MSFYVSLPAHIRIGLLLHCPFVLPISVYSLTACLFFQSYIQCLSTLSLFILPIPVFPPPVYSYTTMARSSPACLFFHRLSTADATHAPLSVSALLRPPTAASPLAPVHCPQVAILSSTWGVGFTAPHRLFLRSGELIKTDRRGQRRRYTFLLFNDLLVYGEELPR